MTSVWKMSGVATVVVWVAVFFFCAWRREPRANPRLVVKHLSPNWLKWRFNFSLQTPVEALMCEDVVEQVPAVCKSDHSWLLKNSCTDTLAFLKWHNKTHTEFQEIRPPSRKHRLEISGWSGRLFHRHGGQVDTWLTPGWTNQLPPPHPPRPFI